LAGLNREADRISARGLIGGEGKVGEKVQELTAVLRKGGAETAGRR
jgi:hypothetical protein